MISRYRIKSTADRREYLDVLRRTETGYHIRIVRCHDGYDDVTESFLEMHLFEMCLETGYIREESPEPASRPEHDPRPERQPAGVCSVA